MPRFTLVSDKSKIKNAAQKAIGNSIMKISAVAILSLTNVALAMGGYINEIALMAGHDKPEDYSKPLPHT